jgi:hypothetical protein
MDLDVDSTPKRGRPTTPISVFDLRSDAGHTPYPSFSTEISRQNSDLQVLLFPFFNTNCKAEVIRLREIIKVLRARLSLKDELIENMEWESSLN